MTKSMLIAGVLLLAIGGQASAKEIAETMAKPVRAVLQSNQQPADLELCLADAITEIGGAVPVPVRNGRDNVVMLGYGHTPKLVVKLDVVPEGTHIEVYTKAGDVDGKFVRAILAACPSVKKKE